jgi:hypothetical protein
MKTNRNMGNPRDLTSEPEKFMKALPVDRNFDLRMWLSLTG